MKISKTSCAVQREPLKAPFGFKGSSLSELWQTVVNLESDQGLTGVGLGTQSTLWSDAAVFTAMSEFDSNSMMLAITEDALKIAVTKEWENPIDLLEQLLPEVYDNAKRSTNRNDLRLTFVLNALVAVDNAAWQLYSHQKKITDFDAMLPNDIKPALSHRHEHLACIPLISYNVSTEQIMEEPFPEELKVDVSDIPARLAADESAHSDQDALERIELGYGAIALKPIAKTMSMSLKIAKLAHDKGVPCFCADLTVNPILVDWNKNVAARLATFPGMKVGILESNGHQNYKNWEQMKSTHPCYGSAWLEIQKGLFHLTKDFYDQSGGIFQMSEHYKV